MLPVGEPLKDSGNSEEEERKKQVRNIFQRRATQEIKMQIQTITESNRDSGIGQNVTPNT